MANKFKIRHDIYNSLVSKVKEVVAKVNTNQKYLTSFFEGDVSRRCQQALLSLIMSDFIRQYSKDGEVQVLKSDTYSLINGKFNYRFLEKIKIVMIFSMGNILVLKGLLYSIFFGKKIIHNNVILHGYGRESLYEGGNSEAAIEFLSKGPFDFINESNLYIGTNRAINNEKFRYKHSKYPLLDLLKSTRFSLYDAISLVSHTIKNYFYFLWLSFNNPIFFLLYSDFLWLPAIYALNRKSALKYYIFDNSDFSKQILPVVSLKKRNFTTHMIFYACNTKGFKYKNVDEVAEHPHYQFMKFDKAWVWNEESKRWLQENSPFVKDIAVVGDVLFYVDNNKTVNLEGSFKILVFDVTPASEEWCKSFAGGGAVGFDFYSSEHMCKFIEGVETSVSDLSSDVKVFIKPKRLPSEKWHDKKYVELLKSSQRIQILDPDINIYELLRGVDLVLAVPFTSALYIADKLEIPSIYYDPTGTLEFNKKRTKYIEFAQSQQTLKQKVEVYHSEKMSHPQ
ncbi:MAG: polysaccharide biosynthesis PFTS motif protein [Bdellovibrionales bacterium]|nr:polysaccharide biosynthesis PFTS motif protein [Bdellovibrionales bacterium]